MPEPIQTLEGWYALHDFRRIDWASWAKLSPEQQDLRVRALAQWAQEWSTKDQQRQASFGAFQVIGHKADLLWLYFCSSLDELAQAQSVFRDSLWAGLMNPAWSYLSVVELSQYMAKGEHTDSPYLQTRLKPSVPNWPYLSFYPMSKRRQGQDNWYMLSQEQRREFMKAHGMIGHHHRSQVTQIITGSQGLDDWEWGVTLFAQDPVAFKKIVYEMRFDESTARFGEFGPFYTAIRLQPEAFKAWFNQTP